MASPSMVVASAAAVAAVAAVSVLFLDQATAFVHPAAPLSHQAGFRTIRRHVVFPQEAVVCRSSCTTGVKTSMAAAGGGDSNDLPQVLWCVL